ncbi:MAG TPA: hypothetical protein PLT92_14395 [Ignavibacteriaceae bacterium]|nr:hypothetical protein [Ignavibacteriaceae bacterium]
MTFEIAKNFVEQIISYKNPELKNDLFLAALRYTQLRIEWLIAEPDQKKEIDFIRKVAHDAFIDSCNILSRAMIAKGENAGWRLKLGNDRKTLGDFACYLTCILGLKARQ